MPATKADKKRKPTSRKIEKKTSKPVKKGLVKKEHNPYRGKGVWSDIKTHEGRRLTIKEAKFIDEMIATGNMRRAAIVAGYAPDTDGEKASQEGYRVKNKAYVADEINYRLAVLHKDSIATREEIMTFWTDMMRGKILDQFDLPTTNSDKLKAAAELAKRSMDIEDRINERKSTSGASEIKIALKWDDEEKGNG